MADGRCSDARIESADLYFDTSIETCRSEGGSHQTSLNHHFTL